LGEAFSESRAQSGLYGMEKQKRLRKIALIRDNISDEKKRSKLKGLQDYLENNLDYLVNSPNERKRIKSLRVNLQNPYRFHHQCSTQAETENAMDWKAHNVLQIRASMKSGQKNG